MEGTKFLEARYKLNADPVVESAARKTRRTTGESVPQSADARIQNYLDRLSEIFDPTPLEGHSDFNRAQRNIQMLKPAIIDRFTTKFEEIPESYWIGQERILRERGQGAEYDRFSEKQKDKWKKELSQGLLEDQRASLEQWIDYLSDPNIVTTGGDSVPLYIRYWIFRSVVNLSEYDKEKGEYPERSKGTIKRFPDINQEALAYVVDALLRRHRDLPPSFEMFDRYIDESRIAEFMQGLNRENFAKLYAWANEQIRPISEHLMLVTEGKWVRYKKRSNHRLLVGAIRGKGTGWCTAGESFAKSQLKNGDFYVYYSNDDDGNPVNPRIAIRMEGSKIAEVRGIASNQNLDPYVLDVLAVKLDEFPDKNKYLKKEKDMKRLTEIDKKAKNGEILDGDDLRFLYEVDSYIQGFGNDFDPRIEELKKGRNVDEDLLTIFNCDSSQIAHGGSEINENTKVYIGEIGPEILKIIMRNNIEYVYTEFPDQRIRFHKIKIGSTNLLEQVSSLKESGAEIEEDVTSFIETLDTHDSASESAEVTTVRLIVRDFSQLADPEDSPKVDDVYLWAKQLGLEPCDPEVAIKYILQNEDARAYFNFEGDYGSIYIPVKDQQSGLAMTCYPDGLNVRKFRSSGQFWPSDDLVFQLSENVLS